MPCILVVEGDDDTKEALRGVLAEEGFEVQVASDEPAAMTALHAADGASAVLIDLREPWPFLDRLAEEHDLDRVNVILMTADMRPKHPRASAVLRMPFSLDELIAAAHRYCS